MMKRENNLLFKLSEWFMNFSVTNMCWFIFNLPIVILVINILFTEESDHVLRVSLLLIVSTPFMFFPATTAMFALAREWILNQEQDSLIKTYLRFYKENYKKSVFGGFIITGMWVIWIVNFYYVKDVSTILMFAVLILGLVLYVFTIHFFSVSVHYQEKLLILIRNAFLLTVGSPVLFFVILITNGLLFYISLNGFIMFVPFFTGSLIAFISFSAFYRLYLNVMEKK
ncbi:MAG TPA: DUF624 domain-containing protein [Virgibacillus sp.]|nr:DUF624 domain-containing protein [Virgibacillus sp.]